MEVPANAINPHPSLAGSLWVGRAPGRKELPAMKRFHKVAFLYLMKNKRNGFVKIGLSRKLKYREQTLQAEEPEVDLIGFTFGSIDDEKDLHERYSKYRLRGEWFSLDETQIEYILRLFQFRAMEFERLLRTFDEKLDAETEHIFRDYEQQKAELRAKGLLA